MIVKYFIIYMRLEALECEIELLKLKICQNIKL